MTPSTIRILLIDDEESDFLMTQALLGRIEEPTMEVEWASTWEEGLRALDQDRHDVCLLDYFLGEKTGLDLLRAARSRGVRTPVILLTGKGSREVDLEAMKAGAVDYLQKGITEPEPVERAIRYAVERHRAQEELRRSEERHRGMFDHLPLGLFRVTAEGEYMEANPALIRILEHPDRETIRRVYAHNYFVSPADREEFFGTLTDQGVVMGFESRLRTASGRPIRVRNTARVHRGPAGRIEYVEGTVEDVTGRVPAEDVRNEAAAFRSLLRSAPLALAVTDPEGRVRSVSGRLEEILGRPSAELAGEVVWDLFPPEAAAELAGDLERLVEETSERTRRAVRLVGVDGEEVRGVVTGVPVTDRSGLLTGLLFLLDEAGAPARV